MGSAPFTSWLLQLGQPPPHRPAEAHRQRNLTAQMTESVSLPSVEALSLNMSPKCRRTPGQQYWEGHIETEGPGQFLATIHI